MIAPSIISNLTGHNQNPQILKRPTKMKMKIYSLTWNNYYLGVLYIYISFLVRKLKTKVGEHKYFKQNLLSYTALSLFTVNFILITTMD